MRNQLLILVFFLVAILGCAKEKNAKENMVFVGSKTPDSFKTANIGAKAHYDKIRTAREAKENGEYQKAINIYTEALASAQFKFEKGVIYLNLSEVYASLGDSENELKYQQLLSEHTGNVEVKLAALRRVAEIRNAQS